MSFLGGWPPEAVIALIALVATNIGTLGSIIYRWRASAAAATTEVHKLGWLEVAQRDRTIETLRRLLHRGWTRETAAITACELLSQELPERLSERGKRNVKRAWELMEDAVRHEGSPP